MRKSFTILALLLSINISFAQELLQLNGWSVIVKTGVSNSNYFFQPLNPLKQLLDYKLENRKLNQNYDLAFSYQLERVTLKIGASLMERGYRQTYNWIPPDGVSGLNDPNLPSYTNMNANYINWSLSLGYSFIQKHKVSITPFANFIYGGLVSFKEETIYGNDKKNTNETNFVNHQFASTILACSFSIDARFSVLNRLGVILSPYLLYTFSDIDNNLIEKSNHSLGANIGLGYKF